MRSSSVFVCVCVCVGRALQPMKSKVMQNKTKKIQTPNTRVGQQEGETLKFKVDDTIDNCLISAHKYEICKHEDAYLL